MSARINELLAQSQALGEQGDVDGAQQAMFEADQVKVRHSGRSGRSARSRRSVQRGGGGWEAGAGALRGAALR